MLRIRPWRQTACQGDHDDHGSLCCCHCHWYCMKHRLKLPESIAFASHLPTATSMHHAAYPAYDVMLLRDSSKMSKMVTACLGSIPMATSSITAACALTFFASHSCTWQLWPDLTSVDGLGMKKLSRELNTSDTSALRFGKTLAADGPSPTAQCAAVKCIARSTGWTVASAQPDSIVHNRPSPTVPNNCTTSASYICQMHSIYSLLSAFHSRLLITTQMECILATLSCF